jgi:membrane fusion protein (multidrug efflux system)
VVRAPYGDSVYVIEKKRTQKGEQRNVVRQQFVRVGETRGDIVSITSGLTPGQRVVASGAFKLRPGAEVDIRAELAPAKLSPKPKDS